MATQVLNKNGQRQNIEVKEHQGEIFKDSGVRAQHSFGRRVTRATDRAVGHSLVQPLNDRTEDVYFVF